MAVVRLSYSGTNVDFGPGEGFDRPDAPERPRHRVGDGSLKDYDFYTPKKRWFVPITDMSKTDAVNINTWWDNRRTCTFYPDYTNDSGTSYSVKIVNESRPMFFRFLSSWDAHYSGELELEET